MIIFREKIFRRDEIPKADLNILLPDKNLVVKYGRPKIRLETEDKYENNISKLGIKGSQDRIKLDKLRDDIKKGYLDVDGPNGGDTHCLGDYSKPGKYFMFSKAITSEHRLNYRVYPPETITDDNNKKYIQRVVLVSCYGHEVSEGDYLNDKNLRARKERMRGNAPYRNKSILNKNNKKKWQK